MAASNLAVAILGMLAAHFGTVDGRPEAPPPRPTLNEVVKEYLRLGLPLPPPDAPLVRVGVWIDLEVVQHEERKHPLNPCAIWRYRLGFQLPPPWPGADHRYWFGLPWEAEWMRTDRNWYDPRYVEPAEPTPDALRMMDLQAEQAIWLAVAFRLRGWDELAGRVYTRALERYDGDGFAHDDVITELQGRACWWLGDELTKPGTDRAAVVRRLRALAAGNKDVYTPDLRELDKLEAGLKPRVSPPGSIEALIDGLTEYRNSWFETDPAAAEAPYWALAEKGFDAVPALIDHLGDKRVTRSRSSFGANFDPSTILTVGHVCCRLLNDLSGETFGGGYYDGRGNPPDPEEVRKWFAAAKKLGEEQWLLRRAEIDHRYALRVVGAKYPDRLPAVYRAALRGGDGIPDALTGAVVASRLTRDEKLTLLTEAADHDDLGHRTAALRQLQTFDPPRFRHHLRRTLTWMRDRAARGELKVPDRIGQGGPEEPSPIDLVPFVERAGD